MKKWLFPLGFVLVTLWLYRDLFNPGVPFTHDGQLHLGRMANFYLAFKEGQLTPRWAPNLNNGFGYPVFNFNYPLYLYLTLPLIVVNFTIEQSYVILLLFLIITAGLGMVYLVKALFKNNMAAIGSGLIYITGNYFLSLVYVRGTIGELVSMALLPWLMLLIVRVVNAKHFNHLNNMWLALVGGAFLISHNITVMISTVFLTGFTLTITGLKKDRVVKLLKPAIVGISLSLFFWVPALIEKQDTVLDHSTLQAEYIDHFATLPQLLFSPWQYGFSRPGPVDSMSFAVGGATLMVFFAASWMWWRSKAKTKIVLFLLISAMLSVFLALLISQLIWQAIPIFSYVQFPWRLPLFWLLSTCILSGWWWSQLKPRWIVVIVLLMIGLTFSKNKAFERFHYPDEFWLTYPHTGSLHDENMPVWFDKTESYALDQTLFADAKVATTNPQASVIVDYWTGSKQRYSVSTATNTTVVQRTAYFPGWEVRVDGQKVPIQYERKDYNGLINFDLAPGTHAVEARFSEWTIARIVGDLFSLAGLLIMTYWVFLHAKGKRA